MLHYVPPPPQLQLKSHAIIMRLPATHGVFYAVLPDDRRLRGMSEVLAYFRDGEHTTGSVICGLYARLLPHR